MKTYTCLGIVLVAIVLLKGSVGLIHSDLRGFKELSEMSGDVLGLVAVGLALLYAIFTPTFLVFRLLLKSYQSS